MKLSLGKIISLTVMIIAIIFIVSSTTVGIRSFPIYLGTRCDRFRKLDRTRATYENPRWVLARGVPVSADRNEFFAATK